MNIECVHIFLIMVKKKFLKEIQQDFYLIKNTVKAIIMWKFITN